MPPQSTSYVLVHHVRQTDMILYEKAQFNIMREPDYLCC